LLSELPILLIAGRGDSYIPYRHTQAAHRLLPQSRLELLDAGHCPHTEHPHLVAELLIDFLTTATTGTPALTVAVAPGEVAAC
jgi:pimeloyl-ACP methyl ester carboxylesterase